jgi:enterochelin esterase-like enzyme
VQFPAPWTGGTSGVANATIYLPPGYVAGERRYPVVYEVPWNLAYWDSSVQLPAILDGLIDGGEIPAEIVAFVSLHGGPYPDSECADSADGREAADSFLVDTIVPWLDAHLRTIAEPPARTLFGFSEGGFCSANLLIRHPDVFRLAIAMSGYYEAGARSAQTLNAWRPFGNDPASLAANSPSQDCAMLPPDIRPQLYVALSGDPTEPFYGPEMRTFGTALHDAGIAYGWLPTTFGHRWGAVREQLPLALEAVGARQAAIGVFR